MDKRKLRLLRFFVNNCDSGYKVIDVPKIYSVIKKYKNNFELFSSDINFLKQHKYIDVKYLDDVNVCLSVLDNSHILQDNIKSDRSVNKKFLLSLTFNAIFSGIMAFLGAFFAIIITR
jgi:hypothetical protein